MPIKKSMYEKEEEQSKEEQELFEHYKFEVDPGQSKLRIDKFLTEKIQNVSRNRLQNAALAGNILVNGEVTKSNYKVRPNDIIQIMMSQPPREIVVVPQDIPINILFEDDDLLIVNKDAGMVVHPAHGNFDGTLVNALAFYFNEKYGQDKVKPNLVHRIDKDTSGSLVVAKSELAQSTMGKLFFNHDIERKYQALVWGDFEEEEGTIEGHIGRSLKNRKVMTVFPEGDYGKSAITHYKVLERFGYVTLVECQLETGRTHQIRAHFKHIGHPLFNDSTYGGDTVVKGTHFTKYKQFVQNCFKVIPRQALHAKSLGFVHPATKKDILIETELPVDMQEVLEKWRHYAKHSKDYYGR